MLGTSDNHPQTPEAINQMGYFHLTLIRSCDCIHPALSGDPWWAQGRIKGKIQIWNVHLEFRTESLVASRLRLYFLAKSSAPPN